MLQVIETQRQKWLRIRSLTVAVLLQNGARKQADIRT
jgi:hypothetical protein